MSNIRRLRRAVQTKHGRAGTPEHISWCSMRGRVLDPQHTQYPDYGGRGISICERWDKFMNFFEDMGERPKGLSLERINNDGDYSPENCKWGTKTEQSRNQRIRKDNTSGARGVRFFQGKFQARINVNKVPLHLGTFTTFEDALKARLKAEERDWIK